MRARAIQIRRREHVKRRAAERYGVQLSRAQMAGIVRQIRENQAVMVHRLTNTKTQWRVNLDGLEMEVIYSSTTHGLVTVLPPER